MSMLALILASSIQAQTRYLDEVFTDVTVTSNVKYGENYSEWVSPPNSVLIPLMMDVYEPMGDSLTERPLVVLAHGGTWLPKCSANQNPYGDKLDSSVVELCKQFARRGYTAVSMDYRLGWNPLSSDQEVRASTIMTAAYLSMQDMKACVRYMKLNSSTYNVDTNKIVIGGSAAGGYAALHYSNLGPDTMELWIPKLLGTGGKSIINQPKYGYFEGEGGNPTYSKYNNAGASSKAHMVMVMEAALGDTSFMNAGELPTICYSTKNDSFSAPRPCRLVSTPQGLAIIEVCGCMAMATKDVQLGNNDFHDQFINDAYTQARMKNSTYAGEYVWGSLSVKYEPWAWYDNTSPCYGQLPIIFLNPNASKSRALTYIDTIMGYFTPRACNVLGLPCSTVGIESQEQLDDAISVYPNPSSEVINVSSNVFVKQVFVYTMGGKLTWSHDVDSYGTFRMDVSKLESGVYFMNLYTEKGIAHKKFIVN